MVKYWFSITDQEQQFRFLTRIHDPMTLPERVFDPHDERRTLPANLYVPDRY